jgi:hypothetical protein
VGLGLTRRFEPAPFQERLDPRVAAGEIVEEFHRILASATGKQGLAEMVAVLAL